VDRFSHGLPDPQMYDPIDVGDCTYERCDNIIYIGERNWDFDGEWFCSASCLAKYLGASKRYVDIEITRKEGEYEI
jgi:hypothetical protein